MGTAPKILVISFTRTARDADLSREVLEGVDRALGVVHLSGAGG